MSAAAASRAVEGGCLCGAVRYRATGAPVNQRVCHCRMCQKALGATFNARLLYRRDAVAITGEPAFHASSEDLLRGFCPRCGATLFSDRPRAGMIGVTAGSLDEPADFTPTVHIWTSSRQPWLLLDDGLPHYPEGAPATV